MTIAHRPILLSLAACLLAAGCADSSLEEATGKADLSAINASVSAPEIQFFLEERNLGNVAFKASTPAQEFDDLNYTVNFDVQVPGETERRRLVSMDVDVQPDRNYVFVFTGSVGNPGMLLWDTAERQWEGNETVFEMGFAHLSPAAGAVDVYFAAPGTAPAAGNAVGTLANGERLDAADFPEGDYVLILTPAGDPQTTLYMSGTRTYNAATTDTLVLFDTDPSTTGDLNVRLVSNTGAATELPDPRFPPEVRVLHATFGLGNIDIAEDGDFNPPLIADLAFGELTPDTVVAAGAVDYTVTAAGNMGAILAEEELTNLAGGHFNRTLVGPVDEPVFASSASGRRPFSTSARLAFTHAASNFETVDIYLLQAGESVADNNPSSINIPFKFTSGLSSLVAGDYEMSLTPNGEKTLIAGPIAIDLANGDVVDIYVLDTVDPNVADVRVVRYTP